MPMNTDQQTLAKGLSRRAAEPALLSHQLPELIELTETQLDAIEGGEGKTSVWKALAKWAASTAAGEAAIQAGSAASEAIIKAAKDAQRSLGSTGLPSSRRG
jgi:hypothetical protein